VSSPIQSKVETISSVRMCCNRLERGRGVNARIFWLLLNVRTIRIFIVELGSAFSVRVPTILLWLGGNFWLDFRRNDKASTTSDALFVHSTFQMTINVIKTRLSGQ